MSEPDAGRPPTAGIRPAAADPQLPVADRIGLIRSTLAPFPQPAGGAHRDRFARLVRSHGAAAVFGYLRRRRIVHAALASHADHPAVADEAGPFWLYRQAGLAIRELHRAELPRLAAAFATDGVPLIAFKGLVLDLLLGNTAAPTLGGDIDLLVRRETLPAARDLVQSLGYAADLRIETGRVRRMPTQLTRLTEESIYSFGQCQPYDRLVPAPRLQPLAERVRALLPANFCTVDGRLHLKISVDLHYSLNLLTDDTGLRVKPAEDAWWAGLQAVPVGDAQLHTLSDEVLSWALLHRLYVDTMVLQETTIKTLCHVALLHTHGRLDVGRIHEAARRYPYLAPSLHYALRAADQLCELGLAGLVDPAPLRMVNTPTMNVGDCLPTLLDLGVAFELADGDGDAQLSVRIQ